MTDLTVDAVADAADPARRLHPGTVLLRILAASPRTLLGLPALIPLINRRGLLVGIAVLGLIGLVSLLVAWLRWRAFTYRITADEVVIADGILNKSRRSIPLERVQDVSLEQKPLARLFGLVTVRIETGGGDADEATLDSVATTEAERLRATIRASSLRRRVAATDGCDAPLAGPDADAAADHEHSLFAMDLRRVLTLGLFRFSLVWIAVIFGILNTLGDAIDFDYDLIDEWYRAGKREAAHYLNIASFVIVGVLAIMLGLASGVLQTLLGEFGFRLTRIEQRLRRVRGLLTRTEVVIAINRVQLALIRRGAISGLLGWRALELQTLGGSNDKGGRQSIAPLARPDEIAPILAAAVHVPLLGPAGFVLAAAVLPPFEPLPLREVSPRHIVRSLILNVPGPLVAVLIATIVFPPAVALLVLTPLPVVAALLARRYHRYALLDGSLQVTRGVLSREAWIVPDRAVQVVRMRQGPLQRLLGIASIHIDTAGAGKIRAPRIIDVDTAIARDMGAAIAARAIWADQLADAGAETGAVGEAIGAGTT